MLNTHLPFPTEKLFSGMLPTERVQYDTNGGCWLWEGAVATTGYGSTKVFHMGKWRTIYAHRAAYWSAHNFLPSDKHICHKCDVRLCVNPDHLWAGTHQDNMDDRTRKGRWWGENRVPARGQKVGGNKLSPEQVKEIRAVSGTNTETAKQYGVSTSLIQAIRSGRIWKWLT